MHTYPVYYLELLIHEFDVEAETSEDAAETFMEGLYNGEYDLSYGELDWNKVLVGDPDE